MPCAWPASAAASASSSEAPSSAAIAPLPTGTAACIASPRIRKSLAVSPTLSAPAAQSAVYSPSEWPAAYFASVILTPNSASSAAMAATPQAISAGCVFAVRVSSSPGPFHMSFERFCPSASSTSSKMARAAGKASDKAWPMPTNWLPWPGNVNASVIKSLYN